MPSMPRGEVEDGTLATTYLDDHVLRGARVRIVPGELQISVGFCHPLEGVGRSRHLLVLTRTAFHERAHRERLPRRSGTLDRKAVAIRLVEGLERLLVTQEDSTRGARLEGEDTQTECATLHPLQNGRVPGQGPGQRLF